VQAVLAARIDRLPPEAKHLLQTAAVIGTKVSVSLLQAIADVPDAALQHHLAHLQAAEFLYETRLFPEREYTFKHALLREGEALTRAHDDQARLALVLARLTGLLRQRAEFAGAIAAGQEALALATARGDLVLQVEATFYLGQAYWAIGDYGRASELFRRNVEALEPGTMRPDRHITSQAWVAFILSHLGQFAEGRRQGEEALRHAMAESRQNEPMLATCYLGRLYLAQGDLEAAIHVLDQSLVLCRAADNWNVGRGTAAGLGYAYALVGRLAEGHALLEEALRGNAGAGGWRMRDTLTFRDNGCAPISVKELRKRRPYALG